MIQTLHLSLQTDTLLHILLLGFLGFAVSMAITPLYTTLAYRGQWWKRQRSEAWSGGQATVYQQLHADKHKRHIPTMAGLVFVLAVALVTLAGNLNRGQTWLPLAAMVASGAIGLVDDWINIHDVRSAIAGMRAKMKFLLQSGVAVAAGWWFYDKLGVHSIYLPGVHEWQLGILVVVLFWFVVIATANSVNISDGLDGLAGGLLVSSFTVYAFISAVEGKYALAAFCLTIVGALLSYTWFNIFPARFFMGDVGSFALGTALGVVAMLTDTVVILPIIGFVFVAEAGSVVIQLTSKKLNHGKKIFKSTPIHHHFEASGWPETKVTMRFWTLGQVVAVLGLMLFILGRYL